MPNTIYGLLNTLGGNFSQRVIWEVYVSAFPGVLANRLQIWVSQNLSEKKQICIFHRPYHEILIPLKL